jgi:hypothetical protein
MSTPNEKHGYTPEDCPENRTGTSLHKCLLCISPYQPPPRYDLRDNATLGSFVIELGERVKRKECTAREFSRAVNVAKWMPDLFSICHGTNDACDNALERIRVNKTLGNYDL